MIRDLVFHIHYCNGGIREPGTFDRTRTKTLSHYELMYFSAGSGRLLIREKRYPIHKGTLLYIYPSEPYTIEMNTAEPAGVLTVHFSCAHVRYGDGKWDVQDEIQTLPLHPAQELVDAYPVEELFKKLVGSWYAKLPGYEFITKTLLQQLIIEISRNLKKEDRNYAASQKIEKIIEFMQQNLGGKVTLSGLSALVQLSPAYLSRVFRESTGYTVIEYFTKLKIDKAKELLLEGGKKVKEVSQLLGFADEFYFSRTFKRIEGMSPSEFYSSIIHEG